MSLQQQIQREIDEQVRIEKLIEKKKLKILRLPKNRCYKLTDTKDKADAFIIFNTNDLTKYNILSHTKDEEENIITLENSPNIYMYPLRHTNRRDTKSTINGVIKSNLIPASSINTC